MGCGVSCLDALTAASEGNEKQMARYLKNRHLDLEQYRELLYRAVNNDRIEIVRLLLEFKSSCPQHDRSVYAKYILEDACSKGCVDIVRLILDGYVDTFPSIGRSNSMTIACNAAVINNHDDILELLLVTQTDMITWGHVLLCCISHSKISSVQILLANERIRMLHVSFGSSLRMSFLTNSHAYYDVNKRILRLLLADERCCDIDSVTVQRALGCRQDIVEMFFDTVHTFVANRKKKIMQEICEVIMVVLNGHVQNSGIVAMTLEFFDKDAERDEKRLVFRELLPYWDVNYIAMSRFLCSNPFLFDLLSEEKEEKFVRYMVLLCWKLYATLKKEYDAILTVANHLDNGTFSSQSLAFVVLNSSVLQQTLVHMQEIKARMFP